MADSYGTFNTASAAFMTSAGLRPVMPLLNGGTVVYNEKTPPCWRGFSLIGVLLI